LKHVAYLAAIAIVTLANVGAPQTSASTAPVIVAPQAEVAAYAEQELPPEPAIELVAEPRPAPRLLDEDIALERELRRYYASVRGAKVPAAPAPLTAAVYAGPPVTGTIVVPILMYHHVAETGPGDDAIRRDLSVSPANFAAQMAYLARNGFVAVSLAELNDHLEHGRPLPAQAVVLTFDDGYQDNYTAAFPALLQNGFTGTFFLITDFVGNGEYMTWAQARVMLAAGMSVESHTLDHPDLATLSAERLARQLAQSKATLEKELGSGVSFLCYPSGKYTSAVMRAAQQAGYRAAVTTVYGDSHQAGHPFELTRVRIRGSDDLEAFAAKVRGPAPSAPRASQSK
jgi:peptidoglycan/xylan/chitin deacetylase (PgdA/CDA1 family)